MTFVPTLNFNGKCHEAMELYKKAFSGKITALMTYGNDGYEGAGGSCLGIDERRQLGSCRARENGAQNRRNLQLDL
ncbi:MAG: hypothetical protein J5647_07385 [Spirochaetaceae bacterium]|nr:hypothetical protein [Spirochaetaceae bacterium]